MDIIFFAAIVAFFFFKLRSVLGKRTGNERNWDYDPFQKKKSGEERESPARDYRGPTQYPYGAPEDGRVDSPSPQHVDQFDATSWKELSSPQGFEQLKDLRKSDPNFDAVGFMAGAKIVFERVLESFAAGRKSPLKDLLAPDVFNAFAKVIDRRHELGHRLFTTLVALDEAKVVEAYESAGKAYITVEFTSRQISATKDRDGHIVEGDPGQIVVINDIWTFSRQIKSRNPNWLLVATGG